MKTYLSPTFSNRILRSCPANAGQRGSLFATQRPIGLGLCLSLLTFTLIIGASKVSAQQASSSGVGQEKLSKEQTELYNLAISFLEAYQNGDAVKLKQMLWQRDLACDAQPQSEGVVAGRKDATMPSAAPPSKADCSQKVGELG